MSEFAVSLVADLEPKIDIIEQVSVYVPSLELFSGPFARDAVTFPLCNNNQVTIDQLNSGAGPAPKNCYCGIFVLDPFLNWGKLAELLQAAKFKGICNFPPLPDFNGEEERALFASEYSFEKEINQIKNYAENAFEMLISYSNDEQHKSAMKLLAGSNVRFCHVDNIQ
jgi:predicted TIM-barrel enzyme